MFGNGKENEALKAKLVSLESMLAGMQEKVALAESNAQKAVVKKTNSILASIGVTQFADENFAPSVAQTHEEILETLKSLTGEAATDFYRANKEKIMRALTSDHSAV
jgi:hypothetical protein